MRQTRAINAKFAINTINAITEENYAILQQHYRVPFSVRSLISINFFSQIEHSSLIRYFIQSVICIFFFSGSKNILSCKRLPQFIIYFGWHFITYLIICLKRWKNIRKTVGEDNIHGTPANLITNLWKTVITELSEKCC